MYSTKDKLTDLTTVNILKKTTEAEIYRHYLGFNFEITKLFSSPFRKDPTPSCGIFFYKNSLLWNDFGGDSGNVWQFVMKITNLKFFDSLKHINESMNLNIGITSNINSEQIVYDLYKDIEIEEKEKSLLQAIIQPYTKTDMEYWNKAEIKSSTLQHFGIYSTKTVFLNKQKLFNYTENNPIYSWQINNGIKVYKPFDKKQKFITTCVSTDIQGLKELDKNNFTSSYLAITKSMKDISIYYECGIKAIAPQSENTFLEYDLIEYLRSNYNIFINFDNDAAGIKAAYYYWNNFNISMFFIDLNTGTKDPFEFTTKYNLQKFKQTLHEQIICKRM